MITLEELIEPLPCELVRKLFDDIKEAYEDECQMIDNYAQRASKPQAVLNPFVKLGKQYIADFFVNDLAKPKKEAYNWHLQNTSQWLYAGCILVANGEVTRHH